MWIIPTAISVLLVLIYMEGNYRGAFALGLFLVIYYLARREPSRGEPCVKERERLEKLKQQSMELTVSRQPGEELQLYELTEVYVVKRNGTYGAVNQWRLSSLVDIINEPAAGSACVFAAAFFS